MIEAILTGLVVYFFLNRMEKRAYRKGITAAEWQEKQNKETRNHL